ncbi:hypothetical protein MTR67_012635 [Solanum verrucosum]|uniref:Uncharacterized protein n=1 Tax=Solanum verrucosum TaxID=315347 RepID=A0AAF0QBN6_SOLVR|nr:hypothetical protein MTR67_012635 [Solanum verrucosum]
MNVKGKTKDTIKTRLDLQEMNIRLKLHPIQNGEKIEVPTACYTLSPEDKHKLFLFLKNLKVPDGFSSNISQCVNLKDHKISRLKRHDCHVLLQHVLPLALRGWKVVRKTQPRDAYEIVEQIDDDIVELGSPSQKKRKPTNEVKFKMKPLKIENEVGSNMKSTIRYTFVAPAAIGKGLGRGLKILGEKGTTPSKSLLPQTSDLVKKYIKEIETSSIEKGREQRLKKSTMFASQRMQTIHKNSIVSEKENVQINNSFPTSAIQVEKYTQEVETSRIFSNIYFLQICYVFFFFLINSYITLVSPIAIGNGLKQKSGSLSLSIGISEYDMGSFDKSDVCANQHMQTPSKSTKSGSTFSSNKKM